MKRPRAAANRALAGSVERASRTRIKVFTEVFQKKTKGTKKSGCCKPLIKSDEAFESLDFEPADLFSSFPPVKSRLSLMLALRWREGAAFPIRLVRHDCARLRREPLPVCRHVIQERR